MKGSIKTALVSLAMFVAVQTNAEMIVHLDASDSDSVIRSGTQVTEWRDLSGNGNHALTTTDSVISYDDNAVNFNHFVDVGNSENSNGLQGNTMRLFSHSASKSWLDFSPEGEALGNGGFTIIVAVKPDEIGDLMSGGAYSIENYFLGNNDSTGQGVSMLTRANTGIDPFAKARGWVGVSFADSGKPTVGAVYPGVFEIIALRYRESNFAPNTVTLDIASGGHEEENMGRADFTEPDDGSSRDFYIGSGEYDSKRALHGSIGELKIYNHLLTDAEIASEIERLSTKWVNIEILTPTGLTATGDDEKVYLDWNDDVTPGGLFDFFNVYRKESGGSFSNIATTTKSQYVDRDVVGETTYTYAISAVSNEPTPDQSGLSVSDTATPRSLTLLQHLKADDGVVTAGGVVSEWQNLAANSNDVTVINGASALYPSSSLSENGKPGVDLLNSDVQLQLFSATESDAWLNQSSGDGFFAVVTFKIDSLKATDLIGNSADNDGFGVRFDAAGKLEAWLGGTQIDAAGIENIESGDTVTVAFNYNSNGTYTFWDSKNYQSVSGSIAKDDFSNINPVTLGSTTDSSRYLDGMVTEVKIYSTYLSDDRFALETAAVSKRWLKRPNILFLYIDDWAWNWTPIALMDNMPNSMVQMIEMPVLEKISKNGMRFSHAYGSAQCTPARATIQTGQTTARHSLFVEVGRTDYYDKGYGNFPVVGCGVQKPLDQVTTSIAEALKPLGYSSSHYGKWHIGEPGDLGADPLDEGYDDGDGPTDNDEGKTIALAGILDDYTIDEFDRNPKRLPEMTTKALNFMNETHDQGKPFYIQMSYYAAHGPAECFKETREYIRGERPDADGNYFHGVTELNNWYADHGMDPTETDPSARDYMDARNDPAIWIGMMKDLDTHMGMLLEELERLGIEDETYIIVQADNGVQLEPQKVAYTENPLLHPNSIPLENPLNGEKWSNWEGGIRVPTFISGPDVPKNVVCDANVVNYDFLPTFLEWAGGDPDRLRRNANIRENIDGISLASIARGEEATTAFRNRSIYFHYPTYRECMPHSVIIKGGHKAIYFYDAPYTFEYEYGGVLKDAYGGKPPVMLFDMQESVGEYDNIALDDWPRAESMYADLTNYLNAVEARIPVYQVGRDNEVIIDPLTGDDWVLKGFDATVWEGDAAYTHRVLATDPSKFDNEEKYQVARSQFMGPFVSIDEPGEPFPGGRPLRQGDAPAPTTFLPVADSQTVSTDKDVAVNIALTGSDDDGDTLTFVKVSDPDYGFVSFTDDQVLYTPNAGFEGNDYFDFRVTTANGDQSTIATVTVVVRSSGSDRTPPTPNPSEWDDAPSAISSSEIAMSAMPASDPIGNVQYRFQNSTLSTESAWQNSRMYMATGLEAETTYEFSVKTRDGLGNEGNYSAPASATTPVTGDITPPIAPTGLAVTEDDSMLTLDWNSNNVEEDFASYTVYRSSVDAGYINHVTGLTISEYVDNSVVNGQTYHYVVTASDTNGNESIFSQSAFGTPAVGLDTDPPTPNPSEWDEVPTAISTTAIKMTAMTATDEAGGIQYRFRNVTLGTLSAWQDSPFFIATGLQAGSNYVFRVKTQDFLGNIGDFSDGLSCTTYLVEDTTPPVAPISIGATASNGLIRVDWMDNSEGDLSSYTVYRSTISGSGYVALATGVAGSEYSDSAVENGTTYYYVVTAIDHSSNESLQSMEMSAEAIIEDSSGLIQHLDATVSGSVVGSPVTQWTDQTTNNNHAASRDGDILSPSVSRSASGKTGLDFGAGNNSLKLFDAADSASWLNGSGFCVLVAFKCDAVNTNDWNDLIGNTSVSANGFGMRYSKTGVMKAYLNGAISKDDEIVTAGDTIVYAFNYDRGTGAYEFWDSKSGVAANGTVTAADFTEFDVTLGRTSGANRSFNGMIGEVKIFNRALEAAELDGERSALVDKWVVEDPYNNWVEENGGYDKIGAGTEDFDGDGVANLAEYALGGSPTNSLDGDLTQPELIQIDGKLLFSHRQRSDDGTLHYSVQSRTNLVTGSWETETYTVDGTNVIEAGTWDEVRHIVNSADEGLYLRLLIEK